VSVPHKQNAKAGDGCPSRPDFSVSLAKVLLLGLQFVQLHAIAGVNVFHGEHDHSSCVVGVVPITTISPTARRGRSRT